MRYFLSEFIEKSLWERDYLSPLVFFTSEKDYTKLYSLVKFILSSTVWTPFYCFWTNPIIDLSLYIYFLSLSPAF